MIKLTSILENIVSEDYPQSFDMKFFKTLQSFASRKKYCDEHLKKIANNKKIDLYLACEDSLVDYYKKHGFTKVDEDNKIYNIKDNKYNKWNFMSLF